MRFQVLVDPDLEGIIPRFMELQFAELTRLEQALAVGDAESARQSGHKFKGAGATYGFHALTDMGSSVEVAAGTGDLDIARPLAEKIRRYLENVEITYGEES